LYLYRKGCSDGKFIKETYSEMRKNHLKKVEEGKKAGEILAEDLSAEEKRKAEFHLILEAIKAQSVNCSKCERRCSKCERRY